MCRWKGRFDDPQRRYRTLYCATDAITCFYEVLAPFRPDPTGVEDADAGLVSQAWRKKHVLVPAQVRLLRGTLVDLGSVAVREQIARRYSSLLSDHGIDHLDRDAVLGPDRALTQSLGRLLYEEGAAGVLYESKLDGICAALFERRARLVATGPGQRLTKPLPELFQACRDLFLSLEP